MSNTFNVLPENAVDRDAVHDANQSECRVHFMMNKCRNYCSIMFSKCLDSAAFVKSKIDQSGFYKFPRYGFV